MDNIKNTSLFNLDETIAGELFLESDYPWEVLPLIKDFIIKKGEELDKKTYKRLSENIWIAKDAKIADSAALNGPLIIDEGAQIRHGAFIRGSAIVGKGAVVGNSCELKNSILFNKTEVPHYNYVGDSILGFHAHMGAGAITSNIKSDRKNIIIHNDGNNIETGMRKIGAILGDYAEIGCNSVLNPGTIIGAGTTVYPLSMVRGVVPADCIYKNLQGHQIIKKD